MAPKSNEDDGGGSGGSKTTIGSETRVTLNFIWSVVAILGPILSMLFMLYQTQQSLKTKLDSLVNSIQSVQLQVSDRWTRSMMVLFATEMELRNHTLSNALAVPNPDEIARRVPVAVTPIP